MIQFQISSTPFVSCGPLKSSFFSWPPLPFRRRLVSTSEIPRSSICKNAGNASRFTFSCPMICPKSRSGDVLCSRSLKSYSDDWTVTSRCWPKKSNSDRLCVQRIFCPPVASTRSKCSSRPTRVLLFRRWKLLASSIFKLPFIILT